MPEMGRHGIRWRVRPGFSQTAKQPIKKFVDGALELALLKMKMNRSINLVLGNALLLRRVAAGL